MSRSIHPRYTADERYERRATRLQGPAPMTRRAAIAASMQEV